MIPFSNMFSKVISFSIFWTNIPLDLSFNVVHIKSSVTKYWHYFRQFIITRAQGIKTNPLFHFAPLKFKCNFFFFCNIVVVKCSFRFKSVKLKHEKQGEISNKIVGLVVQGFWNLYQHYSDSNTHLGVFGFFSVITSYT